MLDLYIFHPLWFPFRCTCPSRFPIFLLNKMCSLNLGVVLSGRQSGLFFPDVEFSATAWILYLPCHKPEPSSSHLLPSVLTLNFQCDSEPLLLILTLQAFTSGLRLLKRDFWHGIVATLVELFVDFRNVRSKVVPFTNAQHVLIMAPGRECTAHDFKRVIPVLVCFLNLCPSQFECNFFLS